MASTAKVIIEEPPSEEADAKEPKRVSSRHQAHEDAARKSTNSKRNLLGSGAGATELQTGDGGTPPASQRTPKRSPPKRGATAGTLAARPAVARSPTSLKVAGEVATPERESPAYMGRSRHAARPWKPSTAHLSHVEEREPKGWTLSHILSKAKWSMAMSKAFSPHININDPNRIKVGVRFRPLSELEIRRGEKEKSKDFLKTVGSQIKITNPRPPPGQEAKSEEYAFDTLYTSDDTTSKVFKDLAQPLVHLLVEGFNGTIFAYGQTGSGKTHSMMGNSSDPGITPRVTTELFDVLNKIGEGGKCTYQVRVSYLQIYREVLHDLLAGKSVSDAQDAGRDRGSDLKIRRDPDRGIYVQNLSEVPLTTGSGLAAIIEQGNKRRAVAATQMNAESSRSHAVVILYIDREDHATGKRKGRKFSSKLNLVDLAGSERVVKSGATGETLKEAIAINQSLSMLGTVINALTDVRSNAHIPYRSSKLTYLLEESLGGNSHTVMLAACSPSSRSYFETSSTLQYAVRAKNIVTNPKANYDISNEVEEAEPEEKKKAGFDYLPRFVRVAAEHHNAAGSGSARGATAMMPSLSTRGGGAKSARV